MHLGKDIQNCSDSSTGRRDETRIGKREQYYEKSRNRETKKDPGREKERCKGERDKTDKDKIYRGVPSKDKNLVLWIR